MNKFSNVRNIAVVLCRVPNWPPPTCEYLGGQLNGCIVAWTLMFLLSTGTLWTVFLCVRFSNFGVSLFTFGQILYPFLSSHKLMHVSLVYHDTTYAIHLTCPGFLSLQKTVFYVASTWDKYSDGSHSRTPIQISSFFQSKSRGSYIAPWALAEWMQRVGKWRYCS